MKENGFIISDQVKTNATLQSSLEQLQVTQMVLTILLMIGVVWFILYLWAMWRCVTTLKEKYSAQWEELNKPTTFNKNFKTLAFVFSDKIKHISLPERWQFQTLRWLAYIGLIYCVGVIVTIMIVL